MLFILQGLGCAAFFCQFFLLEAYSGCVSQILCISRNLVLSRYNKWAWVRWKGWIGVVAVCIAVITYFTWDGPVSIFPVIAIMGGTIGMWSNNAVKIRMFNLCSVSPAWIVYDIIVGAYTGILNESILIGSILVSIYKFGWREMADPNSEFQKN